MSYRCPNCGSSKYPRRKKKLSKAMNAAALLIGGLLPFLACLIGSSVDAPGFVVYGTAAILVAIGLGITITGTKTVHRCPDCGKRAD